MRQIIQKDSLKLQIKTQQLVCTEHKTHINSFNIGKKVIAGARLLCEQCPSAGNNLVFPNQAEDYLYTWYKAEQILIEEEEAKCRNLISSLQDSIQNYKKEFQKKIDILIGYLQKFQQIFQNYISELSQTNLNKQIQLISTEQTLSQFQLQNLAEFISEQTIQPGQIIFNDLIDIKLKRQQTLPLKQTLNIIKHIQKTVGNDLNSQGYLQFINEFDFDSVSDFLNYKLSTQLKGHEGTISSVAISHDNKLIASGDINGLILLWDLLNRNRIKQYNGDDKRGIIHLIFSKNKQYLAVAQSCIPNIKDFNKAYDILLLNLVENTQSPQIRLKGHSNTVYRIQFTTNSKYLLSGSGDQTLKVWKVDESNIISSLALSSQVKGVSLSQNEQMIACGCEQGEVYIFNSEIITTLTLLTKWQTQEDWLGCTIFTPNSQKVITSHYQIIKIWAIDSLLSSNQQYPLSILKSDQGYINEIQIYFNEQILISSDGFHDSKNINGLIGYIKIWNIETSQLIRKLDVPGGYKNSDDQQFRTTSNMRYIVTGGQNWNLKIYERIQQK